MDKNRKTINFDWHLEQTYTQLPEAFFTFVNPEPSPSPQLILLNESVAKSLGLNMEMLKSKEVLELFSGNAMPYEGSPLAQAYAGHQFGHFTMLGDGRAVLLGEHITPMGERFDLQLKGSGRTPYSRGGDGKATLGPMLREYIISEAMHGLGIPTTRALAVVTTGESVFRENEQKGAILVRIASSHLRVGTFQYALARENTDDLRALANYTLQRHFKGDKKPENPFIYLLEEVVKRQASLIAKWQLVGFIHGVMNTDNMALSGETIDYGPCAFMDHYDPETVFSSIDRFGRYAYGKQPFMAVWNLSRFAETLLPLLDEDQEKAIKLAENILATFEPLYQQNWLKGMRAKLGIFNEEEGDEALIQNLLALMKQYQADYTNTFLGLTFEEAKQNPFFDQSEFKQWHNLWQKRQKRQDKSQSDCYDLMTKSNPAMIPRNHLVEQALHAAVNLEDYTVMENLVDALKEPFLHSDKQKEYAQIPVPMNPSFRTFCGT